MLCSSETKKNEKKGKDNVRDLQETLRTNIHIIGSQKEKRERSRNLFEEIMVGNFPKPRKETDIQIQESHTVPKGMNPEKSTQRPILKL